MTAPGSSDRRRSPDAVAGVALLILCGLAFWLTTGFSSVPALLSQNVPPTFFPRLVISLIALLSLLLIARGLRHGAGQKSGLPGAAREHLRPAVLVTAIVIVLATAVLPLLGTWSTLFLVSVVLPLCWGERRWHLILGLAATLPAAVYAVFSLALGVRFPAGLAASLFG